MNTTVRPCQLNLNRQWKTLLAVLLYDAPTLDGVVLHSFQVWVADSNGKIVVLISEATSFGLNVAASAIGKSTHYHHYYNPVRFCNPHTPVI